MPKKIAPHLSEKLTELQIQSRIVRWGRETYPDKCAWLHAVDNGAYKSPIARMNARRAGVRRGVADLFLPVPSGNLCGLYIEVKCLKGRVTPAQQAFRRFAVKNRYGWVCARTVEDGCSAIAKYLSTPH